MDNNIILEGGKGGGGAAFSEQDNTLKSNTYVSTLEAIGYGLQGGLVNGLESVYLDNTALVAADGTYNFNDVSVAVRDGSASQTVITGFENIASPVVVNTDVVAATPVQRTVSAASVAAVGVTIRLPNGLYNQNTTNNSLEKTTLRFQIKTKLTASGSFVTVLDKTYNDKTTGPYEETFRIDRPAGTGTWDVQVVRVTADSGASTLRNSLNFAYLVEYEAETLTYNNVALLGVSLNAQGVNASRIPVISADWYGRIIQVPNVLDTKTRVFSGVWDLATFKNDWCNDPAWVLYDLATDTEVGLGLDPNEIDIASFYSASIYNNTQVSFTGSDSVTVYEPRYSFNYQITEAFTAIELLNQVAGAMNATLLWVNGQLTLIQDRPDTFSHVFTNANVVGGRFSRAGTPYDTRYTVANVTWNAPADGFKQRITSVQDAAGIALYGYNEANIAAFGCTSMAQATRYAKHYLYSSLYTPNTISFTAGEVGALVVPGDLIRVYDNVYAGANAAGRLLAGSTTTVLNLDRAVSLSADATVTVWGMDGTLFTDVAITTTGTASTITLTTALASAPTEGAIFQITTNGVSPETYRVMDREEKEPGQFLITAGLYTANKWTYVEGGLALPVPKYSNITAPVVSAPTGLSVYEKNIYTDLSVSRVLHVSWVQPVNQIVTGYRVTYTFNGGTRTVTDVKLPYIEIDAVTGTLSLTVQALSYRGIPSRSAALTYTVVATETTGSTLNAPTTLVVAGTAGTTFTTPDLIVQWTNPSTNGTTKDSVARFKVEVYNGATLLRSQYVEAVPPGQTQTYTYAYDNNVADGGPRRSIIIKVYCQDGSMKLSSAATATFTNNAPAVPSGLTVSGGVGQVFITSTLPTDTDYAGTLVWASLTTGFTPGAGNLVYDGSDSVITIKSLGAGAHFIKVAHYDSFGKDFAGTGLNVSTQQTTTPSAGAGIPSGTTNPGTGAQGDLFFNTTDNKLYRYTGSAWTAAVPTVDLTGTVSTAQIADSALTAAKFASTIKPVEVVATLPTTGNVAGRTVFLTTDSKLYRYDGTNFVATVPTSDLTGTIGTTQIADSALTAAKFASTIKPVEVVATLPTTGNVEGRVVYLTTDNKIYRYDGAAFIATVAGADIAANSITAGQIAAGAIGADEIAANAITTKALLVTGNNLVANSDFATGDYSNWRIWAAPSNQAILAATDVLVPAGAPANYVCRFFFTSASVNIATFAAVSAYSDAGSANDGFDVLPGNVYDVRINAVKSADYVAGSSNVMAYFYKNDGTWTTNLVAITGNPLLTTSWSELKGSFTAPAGALKCWMYVIAQSVTAGSFFWTRLRVKERANADLIVDGAVTAAKIAANTITAGQIASGAITADEIAANAIATSKLLVTGRGAAHNDDPMFTDTSAWTLTGTGTTFNVGTTATGNAGSSYLSNSTGASDARAFSRRMPINPNKTYSLTANVFAGTGNNRNMYIVANFFNAAGTQLATTPNWGGTFSGYIYGAQPTIGVWTEVGGKFGDSVAARPIPATAAFVEVGVWFQYSGAGTSAVQQACQNLRFTEAVESALIVDGTITATQIAAGSITGDRLTANTITAGQIAASTITTSQIAANTIAAGNIAAGAVTTAKLAAGAVTANEIAANTITAAKIAAGTITATEIAAGTITAAKMAAGTITANEIATGTITAAKMTAGTITAASGIIADAAITTAKIGTAQVNTLQLAGQAVTIPLGSTSTTGDASITYTSTGAPVIIIFSTVLIDGANGNYWASSSNLKKGTTTISTIGDSGVTNTSGTQYHALTSCYYDTPSAGSVTYTVNNTIVSGSDVTFSKNTITLIEVKR
ncbi:phage tail protein [Leptothrix discophora]|uniref:Phage tail protein n=1 Tax=Leptothrix discophora TaxID=89 RepID=A0ABT9G0J4_LEPDI|nr:phage tail protein [Leptothrix discophora]MDP4299936.1 phage tail protein [Leptothrix discophora]